MPTLSVPSCQWHGCVFLATSYAKRGEDMEFLALCIHHRNQFRVMTNAECAEVARTAQPTTRHAVGTRYVARGYDPDTHAPAAPRGRRIA